MPAMRHRSCTLAIQAGLLHACVSRPRARHHEEAAERTGRPSQYANMPDLVVILVDATALACLILQTRPHTKCWGGFIRQLQPRWRE